MERRCIPLFLAVYILIPRGSVASLHCTWDPHFELGHDTNGSCVLFSPTLPPSCAAGILRVTEGLNVTTLYSSLQRNTTNGSLSFTVPAPREAEVHLHCEVICPGLETNPSCQQTITGGYPPAPPSQPQCHIMKEKRGAPPEMNCSWHLGPDSLLRTEYTFHLRMKGSTEWSTVVPAGLSTVMVPRSSFVSHVNGKVWVSARNALGKSQSKMKNFNSESIVKLEAPRFVSHEVISDMITVMWNNMDTEKSSDININCRLRYREEGVRNWTEANPEDVSDVEYTLDSPQPFTHYLFQVSCMRGTDSPWSEWSHSYKVQSSEAAPVGMLDVWFIFDKRNVTLYWKELSRENAQGSIRVYEVRLEAREGVSKLVNVSRETVLWSRARERADGLREECLCIYSLPKDGVFRASVVGYNGEGKTLPATVNFSSQGLLGPSNVIAVNNLEGRSLKVSWTPPPGHTEYVQYVVQSREVGLSLSRPWIHWTRCDINHTIALLTGNFKPFTSYNVSVFAVYSNGTSQPSSVLVYTQQGAPSAGPELSVSSIGHTQVNLTWREIALTHRKGIIRRYHLRLAWGGATVAESNVSADWCWAVLSDLQPGQEYQVWVSAETDAMEGNRSTIRFSTTTPDSGNHLNFGIIILCVVGSLVILITIAALLCNNRCSQTARLLIPLWCYQKVPDPVNSRLNFTEVTHQNDDQFHLSPAPSLSVGSLLLCDLELLDRVKPELETEGERQESGEERERDYSTMKDSEGGGSSLGTERERQDPESRSHKQEEQDWESRKPFISDYEKHFMPSPEDIM
ncbi:interleukin-12 receptor subunit beta-2-like [Acipenser ruthenus]|uniref:interleukin-12 receptor subunit beta-2-like n=1 Tax=Acipenser ruthenus TaxID=7906 RepID=UPI0027426989|nr:interleukin-12 receptor subunit beta-2-like [Acipenser ruthenus]XP_058863245.1 interleukin-12 receptor subunit beta-2-like [Acipenser ruthenus]XP_058863246.1 interleukin-12 receptor subunit beta-2-like [Acipenser ruthenus]XP_058863247.1 interleukin-12 receptor subunit beta-2-like [Acipenser ruthenus]XP_058863248.1 interleukin-12 receptor subunit beta-2-like [Acipenser ruthenus]